MCVESSYESIEKFKKIRSCHEILHYWFGHECIDDDDEYKLVIGTASRDEEEVKYRIHLIRPYAEEDCDWKSTQKIDKNYYFSFFKGWGTLSNGRVHWLVYDESIDGNMTLVVFSYDLRRETIIEVPPHEGMDRSATLCVMNGCLSAIRTTLQGEESILEVWMMKEYGVKESWTKFTVLMAIDIPSYGILKISFFLVGVTDKGDLIVNVGGSEVVLYNLGENKSKTLMANGCGRAIMYVESLVFPQVSKKE